MKRIFWAPLALASAFAAAQNYDSGTGLGWAIPDNTPGGITRTLSVSGVGGPVLQVDIYMNPAHTFAGDLTFTMVSPDARTISLLVRPGDTIANTGASNRSLISMFFADTGSSSDVMGSGAAIDSATTNTVYRISALSTNTLANIGTVNGTYTFTVSDSELLDTGTIDRVRILSVVPEPTSMIVLGLGAAAMAARRRRRS